MVMLEGVRLAGDDLTRQGILRGLVVIDLTIPGGVGGRETIEALIKFDPEVKVIVSSGYSNDPIMAN